MSDKIINISDRLMKTRKGDYSQLYSGNIFWTLDPRPEEVFIEDIAHALSNLCRFTGHCNTFYSVAEHCINVSRKCSNPENALWGLLHDASEAYINDLQTPVKAFLLEYQKIEKGIERVIKKRFNIGNVNEKEIKEIDIRMLITERNDNMKPPFIPWECEVDPYDIIFDYYTPKEAESEFLKSFDILYGMRML